MTPASVISRICQQRRQLAVGGGKPGNDTRPNRVLNPIRQARRFDPDGTYVRRLVHELAGIEGRAIHEPWKLNREVRGGLDYPDPLVPPPG